MNFDVDVVTTKTFKYIMDFFADGGCHNNGKHKGIGSWAYALLDSSKQRVSYSESAGVLNTTNNRMELEAVLAVLRRSLSLIQAGESLIRITSDSKYVGDIWNKYLDRWCGNFTTLANPDQLAELWQYRYHFKDRIELHWVKGHSGNIWNEMVDEMCTLEMEKLTGEPRKRKKKQ